MPRMSENVELIAAKIEEVSNDPAASAEQMRFWLRTAAGVLSDVAKVLPADLDYGLEDIDPEGRA